MSARADLLRFLKEFAGAYQVELSRTEPGEDPSPFVGMRVNDGDMVVAALPGVMLADERRKDLLFGSVLPAAIAEFRAEMAAFACFSWHTVVPRDIRERVSALIKSRGEDPNDSALVRRYLEREGVVVAAPTAMGRVESCSVTAVSRAAEAMLTARVEREPGRTPRVAWVWEDVPDDDDTEGPWGVFYTERNAITKGIGGRVVEGMREGLDAAAKAPAGLEERVMADVIANDEGFQRMLAEGVEPEQMVLKLVEGFAESLRGLMGALPSNRVSPETRHQVMALATVIDNTLRALRAERMDATMPDHVRAGLAALAEALAEMVGGDADDEKRGTNGYHAEEQ